MSTDPTVYPSTAPNDPPPSRHVLGANGRTFADEEEPQPSTALVRRSPFDQARELVGYLKDIDIIAGELCKATLLPKNMQAPANLKLVLLQGLEMGFSVVQAIRASYVIESKEAPPRVGYYVEALVALVRKSPVCRFFRVEECNPDVCRVVCARKDEDDAIIHTFELTMKQAIAGRLDQRYDWERKEFVQKFPWKSAPSDMLRNRCCGRAVKTVFQDVVFGMSTPDELDDLVTAERADAHGGFAPVPAQAEPKVYYTNEGSQAAPDDRPMKAPAGAEIIEAELVGTGDAGWDELLDQVAKLASVDTAGWLPPELLELWERKVGEAKSKAQLNALAPWIGAAKKGAGKSKACSEVATQMSVTFNERSAKLKEEERAAAAAKKPEGAP
jgi:hypothetical protein